MFQVCKKAGVTPADIARMLNLNRVTVSMWFNNRSAPHSMLRRRVDRLLQAIKSAVDKGDLPLSSDVPRTNRHAEIAKTIHRHLKQLGLEPVGE